MAGREVLGRSTRVASPSTMASSGSPGDASGRSMLAISAFSADDAASAASGGCDFSMLAIYAYAFFKFAWSYRLFAYVAILLGALPLSTDKDSSEAETHVLRTARLLASAGLHFNRGQRAFFFALGYLGWFIGPVVFMLTTALVLVTMWRRQFSSDAFGAVASKTDAPPS